MKFTEHESKLGRFFLNVETNFNDDEIRQTVSGSQGLLYDTTHTIIKLRDQGVREALIKLGWTPPPELRVSPKDSQK